MVRQKMGGIAQWGQRRFSGSSQWDFRVHALLDEAVYVLTHRGFIAGEEEAVDLLEAAGTIQHRDGQWLILHASALRKVLDQLPSAFNLFDRQGSKVRTVSGGVGAGGNAALHATVVDTETLVWTPHQASSRGRAGTCHSEECSVDAACQSAGRPWVPKAADLPGITSTLAGLPGFDLLGTIPPPSGMPRPLGQILRVYLALLYSSKAQLIRPRDGVVLGDLGDLLCALRGSVAAVEEKPLVILEAIASEPLKWNAVACRVLIDGARRGFPVAPVAALPRDGEGPQPLPAADTDRQLEAPEGVTGTANPPWEAPGSWAAESVATLLAAALIHQLARERAPLLWGVPFIQPLALSPSWS
ncbi:MAG: hypothetical protein KAY24_09215, partial [Candidatus Eisenbacteria sp.]|nr:hypothetical protein [Candidatus Eisenbacteria bacterium]